MTTFTVESKSALAKLMATENVTIEHRKMSTARFDPINRVLYLPIWKNMSGYMYDLLGGHEVGHARWTPADGWHNAVIDPTKKINYKSFLNVVEDARIEKKIQRKYPGLRNSFRLAYAELMEQDFFGIIGKNINKLPFIDRLNIYTKSQYTANIKFNEIESGFMKRIIALESWEEVIILTDEIYAYSKGEQNQIKQNDFENFNFSDSSDEDGGEYDLEQSDEDGESEDGESEDGESEDGESEDGESEDGESGKSEEDSEEEKDKSEESSAWNRNKESSASEEDQFDPECKTDDTYRSNEVSLLDDQCKEYIYLTIPKPIHKNIITPVSRVQELLSKHFNSYPHRNIEFSKYVTDFKRKNERYVSLLSKEFEMRKAATKYSKAKISNTGDLDINKLSSYKFDDNIFRKMTIVPKGKSHGMILLLDRSGSMSENLTSSIEQILVLSMFCRKVNIPFVVYGFGDDVTGRKTDFPNEDYNKNCFEAKDRSIGFNTVFLREYLNSSMSSSTFSNAFRNMVLLMKTYDRNPLHSRVSHPPGERLSNTPLLQAMVAMKDIMVDFKKKNNLDLTNLVIVHDGDADRCFYYKEKVTNKSDGFIDSRIRLSFNTVIVDNTSKFQYQLSATKNDDLLHAEMTKSIFDWFQKTTESKIFGFFLAPTSYRGKTMKALENQFYDENGKKVIVYGKEYHQSKEKLTIVLKQLRKDKFIISKKPGFNSFFIVVGGDELAIGDEELNIEGKFTTAKLKNAFSNLNKKKLINRVLVSKFIQGIAA